MRYWAEDLQRRPMLSAEATPDKLSGLLYGLSATDSIFCGLRLSGKKSFWSIMTKKNQSNTMLDQSSPGSTTDGRSIDSIYDVRDMWTNETMNTIKIPTQGTSIGTWNFRPHYAGGRN